MTTAPRTTKTLATLVFHGPADDKAARSAVTRLARDHGGRLSYNSFQHRDGRWHAPGFEGKAAYKAMVPVAQYRAAVKASRALSVPGLTYSHRWSHFGTFPGAARKAK